LERVEVVKLLGVYLDSRLNWTPHIDSLLKQCNQRIYLICMLKKLGLSTKSICTVFDSLILSRLGYASQAWSGHLTNKDRTRLDKFHSKANDRGLTNSVALTSEAIFSRNDERLLKTITSNSSHCLTRFLPSKSVVPYDLRKRCHPFDHRRTDTSGLMNSFFYRIFKTF
jgi:hypothetical protein